MKKALKLIAGSVVTAALCASIISGATLALFTSKSEVNIAITTATINVTATVSKTGSASSGNDVSSLSDDQKITFSKRTAEEPLSFTVTVTNESTVNVQYQLQLIPDAGSTAAAASETDAPFTLRYSIDTTSDSTGDSAMEMKENAWVTQWIHFNKPAGDANKTQMITVTVTFNSGAATAVNTEDYTFTVSVKALPGNANPNGSNSADPSGEG